MDHEATAGRTGPFLPEEGPAHDHRCRVYADGDDRRAAAAAYLADGRRHGLRVAYAGPGPAERLRAELQLLPGAAFGIDHGTVLLVTQQDLYGRPPVDPALPTARYRALTEQALADGYAGFRVFADVTGLVGAAEDHDAFARYELGLGPVTATMPLSAMCAYRATLPADRLTDLVSVHPVGSGRTPFRLTLNAIGMPRLVGEVDASDLPRFSRAVSRLPAAPGDELVVDCSGARYLDHRALAVLDARGASDHRPVVLLAPPTVVARVVELLGLRHLQVVGSS